MTLHYSNAFEALLSERQGSSAGDTPLTTTRVLIVGSGYGGAVAAFRMSNADEPRVGMQHDVIVLERGKEYLVGEFPNTLAELPENVRVQMPERERNIGNEEALFDVRVGDGVDILVGSGLGGGSLINAAVAIAPDLEVFRHPPWPTEFQSDAAQAELGQAFERVSTALGVSANNGLSEQHKYRHFAATATTLRMRAEPAPLAITFPTANGVQAAPHVGLRQAPCNNCGNCITGCNVGAKNTLAMNLIPSARERGALFFTGGKVLSIEPTGRHPLQWRVYVQPVDKETRVRHPGVYSIDANHVVLAAGTLGSTEILQRSQQLGYLRCSRLLGHSFTTNGDTLAATFAGTARANALGRHDPTNPGEAPPGPTITAMARAVGPTNALLQDAVIPAPLVEAIEEIVTTGAQIQRLGTRGIPGWYRRNRHDSIASNRVAMEHSQVLLVMGDDPRRGTIEFDSGESDARNPTAGQVNVRFDTHQVPDGHALSTIDSALAEYDRTAGLNGGQYVRYPPWRFEAASSGGTSQLFSTNRAITVHPLGGCAMGNSGNVGVVDHRGFVFRGDSASTYPGLQVLDGSIIPTALGVNPLLTIAALAWRASGRNTDTHLPAALNEEPRREPRRRVELDARDCEIVLREQLEMRRGPNGENAKVIRWVAAELRPGTVVEEQQFLRLRLETNPSHTERLLDDGRDVDLCVVTLHLCTPRRNQPDVEIELARRVASCEATASIMERVPFRFGPLSWLARFIPLLSSWFILWLRSLRTTSLHTSPRQSFRQGFWGLVMHTEYRRFVYDLSLVPATGEPGRIVRIRGQKLLAATTLGSNLLRSLTELHTRISIAGRGRRRARWVLDLDYLANDGMFGIASVRNVPFALMNCARFALRFVRGVVQSSLREFRAPNYPDVEIDPNPQLPPRIGDFRLATVDLPVARTPLGLNPRAERLTLKLHCYRQPALNDSQRERKVVLLLHGLAQGSLIFAPPGLRTGMAQYLLAEGYDVWLLDYRLSNQLGPMTDGWSMDELGRFDIPDAVHYIHQQYGGRQKISIFAHCVGAVATAMAILTGRITRNEVSHVAFNAIHPWLIPSYTNKVRSSMGVAFRDLIGNDYLDPIVRTIDRTDDLQRILDRIAYVVGRWADTDNASDFHKYPQSNEATCDRMTLLYGRMWNHANVRQVHPHWCDLVGPAPGAVYRHLYYMITRERLVDREGQNIYLTEENLRLHWSGIHTLFMHGQESQVFDSESARRSAVRLTRNVDAAVHTKIRLLQIDGYGHMDVVFADDAHKQSYPYIADFFADVNGRTYTHFEDADDPRVPVLLECGPILRGARVDAGVVTIYWWGELPRTHTLPCETFELEGDRIVHRATSTEQEAQPRRLGMALGFNTYDRYFQWIETEFEVDTFRGFYVWPRLTGAQRDDVDREYGPLPSRHSWLERLNERDTSKRDRTDCAFLIASCRYPGVPFDSSFADAIFGRMSVVLDDDELPCDLLFLIGDQIYADARGDFLDPISWRDRYEERYRAAFHAPRMREVLSRIPVHFALDDHEFADNFAGVVPATAPPRDPRLREDRRSRAISSGEIDPRQFMFARETAWNYMAPYHNRVADGDDITQFWYELEYPSEVFAPAFVLDTRSERTRPANGDAARLMSDEQLAALLNWLTRVRDFAGPKFIFAGSVIAPLQRDAGHAGMWMREDGLVGYPRELSVIVEHIVRANIKWVVFVGGDLHFSCVAELTLRLNGYADVQAVQVVASALYAPIDGQLHDEVRWEEPNAVTVSNRCGINYIPYRLCAESSQFVRLTADWTSAEQCTVTATAFNGANDDTPEVCLVMR